MPRCSAAGLLTKVFVHEHYIAMVYKQVIDSSAIDSLRLLALDKQEKRI